MGGVEVARAESERGELVLRLRDEDGDGTTLELRANGVFVMDTRETRSERALAQEALARHDEPARVLVGGLGLGFTLAAVLDDERVRRVTVVEIEPALVGWLLDETVPSGPALLADERVELVVDDVARALAATAPGAYDAVLLDVDNGPGYLVHDANAALYGVDLLAATRRALAPGGLCVIWSADRNEPLHQALGEVFGDAEATAYDVNLQGRAEQYWLYLARRDGQVVSGS
jgi:spermidine synthase